ncbi:MAG: hypothetical protein JWM09_1212 [Francisellaceae bacterium]|nr:hypothetical protein [Francisellaceae bacterium]
MTTNNPDNGKPEEAKIIASGTVEKINPTLPPEDDKNTSKPPKLQDSENAAVNKLQSMFKSEKYQTWLASAEKFDSALVSHGVIKDMEPTRSQTQYFNMSKEQKEDESRENAERLQNAKYNKILEIENAKLYKSLEISINNCEIDLSNEINSSKYAFNIEHLKKSVEKHNLNYPNEGVLFGTAPLNNKYSLSRSSSINLAKIAAETVNIFPNAKFNLTIKDEEEMKTFLKIYLDGFLAKPPQDSESIKKALAHISTLTMFGQKLDDNILNTYKEEASKNALIKIQGPQANQAKQNQPNDAHVPTSISPPNVPTTDKYENNNPRKRP